MKVTLNKQYIIGSQGVGVHLSTKNVEIKQLWREVINNPLPQRFIPDLSFEGEVLAQLEIVDSKEKTAYIKGNFGFIQGVYNQDFNSTDVIVVAEYLLERLRQEKDIFTIHSSAVYKDDAAVLFVANLTGSGKTSTALFLHNKFGFDIFSDEKTHINSRLHLVGQVNRIILENKTKNILEFFGLNFNDAPQIKSVSSKKLSMIVIPIIVESCTSPNIEKYSRSQVKWLIYEELSRDIRLINGLVHNFSYPLMSQDDFELAQKRERLSENISQNVPVYLVKGQLNQISDMVNRLFEELLLTRPTF